LVEILLWRSIAALRDDLCEIPHGIVARLALDRPRDGFEPISESIIPALCSRFTCGSSLVIRLSSWA
jgi:hypothetical protein